MSEQVMRQAVILELERCLKLGLAYTKRYQAPNANAYNQRLADMERIEHAVRVAEQLRGE